MYSAILIIISPIKSNGTFAAFKAFPVEPHALIPAFQKSLFFRITISCLLNLIHGLTSFF